MPDLDGKGPRKRSPRPSRPLGGLQRGLNKKKPIKKPIKAPAKVGETVKSGNLRITRIKKK